MIEYLVKIKGKAEIVYGYSKCIKKMDYASMELVTDHFSTGYLL